METVSALLAICAGNSPVPGEFPTQRPATRGFDVFFDPRPEKRLSKQWWSWWLETPSHSLWRHRNVLAICYHHQYQDFDYKWSTCQNQHYGQCMAPHKRHGLSNHRLIECLFSSLFMLTTKKISSPCYWPFVRGMHRWPVDSPHKGPETRKAFPCLDVITSYGFYVMSYVNISYWVFYKNDDIPADLKFDYQNYTFILWLELWIPHFYI